MIKSCSEKMAYILTNNNLIEDSECSVYAYGFEVMIASFINFLLTLIVGFIFNKFIHTIVFLASYCLLRQFAGGYHASNHRNCTLIFLCMFLTTILLSNMMIHIEYVQAIVLMFSICNYIGIFILSPIEHRNNPLNSKEKKIYGKISKLIVTILLVIIIIIAKFNNMMDYVLYISFAMFWSNIMLILAKFKNGGN
ncbi:accessory gene regulator B family protein [Clostridioides sp. ZZV14-6154]|uniref:accessory gene regulator ArgB-like protein n=1 Tax=Clostridioides sp. ZZV14-6154 TaxID=2811495 RepID=UPI001D102A48|nr:accessory gene regulator B family protein [Clostridioides sp. ZZV14-6154]